MKRFVIRDVGLQEGEGLGDIAEVEVQQEAKSGGVRIVIRRGDQMATDMYLTSFLGHVSLQLWNRFTLGHLESPAKVLFLFSAKGEDG